MHKRIVQGDFSVIRERGFVTCGTVALLVTFCLPLQVRSLQDSQPDETTNIQTGTRLYGQRCADCHGADAKGFTGPDLTGLWVSGQSDTQVLHTIRFGRPGSIMPSSTAPDEELNAIVAYLKSIGTVPVDWNAPGNIGRGRAIFRSECQRCHWSGQDGGRLGPDLSRIADTRSRAELARSIREPSAAIVAAYTLVALVTRDGDEIRGVRKGEDAFSIQIVDVEERLQGYRKAGLRSVAVEEESLMPVFGVERLDDGELNDLLKFLGTLRRVGSG